MKDIFAKITIKPIRSFKDLNIDMAFKMTWASFLQIDDIIYIATELKKNPFL